MTCSDCGQYNGHQNWCRHSRAAMATPQQFMFTAPAPAAPSVTVVSVQISADDIDRIARRVVELLNADLEDDQLDDEQSESAHRAGEG